MTKRQTRLFFLGGTALFAAVFLALTVDTHRQVGRLTHAENMTPQVVAGEAVWHRYDCVNCHTLLGEGAYYAPDLTNIASQRGAAYLHEFLTDPSSFYSEAKDRRLMPTLGLSEEEITDVIAFLSWVDKIDNNGWPPRPILVSGSRVPGLQLGGAPAAPASNNPVAMGEMLFRSTPPGCSGCHSTTPGVSPVGPSLAGIADTAAAVVKRPDYTGSATDAEGFIRESILEPSAYIAPGGTYSFKGQSIMIGDLGSQLTPTQVDQLVAYLMTLK